MALELPNGNSMREMIKCVVIGDSGCGKTKLICAQALGQCVFPVERQSLLQCSHGSHKPSVFAIDKYYKSNEVQERSNMVVDGVEVALRLWDTFGDHQKNRRFAYQHSHVVALCFAVNCPSSLESVNNFWYKEIKNYCPRAPIILVGTKADCRSLDHNVAERQKSKNFSQQMRNCTTVSPDMGRQVAKEIGAYYYECSVLHKSGLEDVFYNIIRAALCSQRAKRLLSKQLRKVLPPQLQVPQKPPKPQTPQVEVPPSTYHTDIGSLFYSKIYYDVVFACGDKLIEGHRAILAAASCKLLSIFVNALKNKDLLTTSENDSLCNEQYHVANLSDHDRTITVINLNNTASFSRLYTLLELIYRGIMAPSTKLEELLDVAEFLQITMFRSYFSINQILSDTELFSIWKQRMIQNMRNTLFQKELFADICFELEGTIVPAHKAVLVSRCEMMAAMFEEGHFKEANRQMVKLTDMNLESFLAILEYIYTDEVSKQYGGSMITAMALANFFCLPRLVALYEQLIVEDIEVHSSDVKNIIEYLLVAEMHNAAQLKSWGEHYIIVHYDKILQQNQTALRLLPVNMAETLEAQRWPPLWYLMENEWYNKTIKEQEQMQQLRGKRKWYHKTHI